ncbi:MAG: glycosyltransferase [Planctomycetaceae bacterium]|nr:glycosyltransferase [Planctomycetaceae bacterium]
MAGPQPRGAGGGKASTSRHPSPALSVVLLWPATVGAAETGNRATALRWAGLWRSLGARVHSRPVGARAPARGLPRADLVVALHAVKCAGAFLGALDGLPNAKSILALAGTDWPAPEAGTRRALPNDAAAALERADRILALQPRQGDGLPPEMAQRIRVVTPSARVQFPRPAPPDLAHEVLALGNLRRVKDPLLLARAMDRLPPSSLLRAVHLGHALDEESRGEAERESARNPRWTWLGGWPRARALARLVRAEALVNTSRSEGASGAIVEALAHGVPVLATSIDANLALLGPDWPAVYPPGDASALAQRLSRLELDRGWRAELALRAEGLAARFAPEREREDWRRLWSELGLLAAGSDAPAGR